MEGAEGERWVLQTAKGERLLFQLQVSGVKLFFILVLRTFANPTG